MGAAVLPTRANRPRDTGGVSDWEGGWRPGIRWWRVGIAAALVVIAVAAYITRATDNLAIETGDEEPTAEVSEFVDVVVTSPLRADDRWYCPSTHPFRAGPEGSYYPPGHPGNNQLAPPDACYESADRAKEAGYLLAEPPPGTDVVEGIYVEPTRSPSMDDCRELAVAVGYTVPCPTRLPAPADGPPCGHRLCVFPGPDGLAQRRPRHAGIVIQHDGFAVPAEVPWVGVERDVVVTAVEVDRVGRDGVVRVAGPEEFVSCFPENGLKPQGPDAFRTCVDGRPWVPGFGGLPLEGHTSAVWRRGDVVYAAGVVGAGDHIEALLATIIDGIEYVDPPS
jgi:hypothetical protein